MIVVVILVSRQAAESAGSTESVEPVSRQTARSSQMSRQTADSVRPVSRQTASSGELADY
ncbi:hypothetical protein Taro_055537 [Colocasia esculenta]|uniref:Uncharacterized protein n=1 Tax=Colocasia esculenta TaxID=4460 RepID=A0A843XRJ8_COLES|nr:hypothetical protein [Colocasia esculenta]